MYMSPQELLLKFDWGSSIPRAQLLRNGRLSVVASLEEGQLRKGVVIDHIESVGIDLGLLWVVQMSVWREMFWIIRGLHRVMVVVLVVLVVVAVGLVVGSAGVHLFCRRQVRVDRILRICCCGTFIVRRITVSDIACT